MVEQESNYERSDCPICGQDFPHLRGKKPVCCGRYDCLHEANRRGLYNAKVKESVEK
ncbi:hypothetical protein LCGC14_2297170 [marine sediment metagenome]|uniref:Uncharacterized protein n=1 Tax=marine sediment metagenome TaxID=412755 RepID=A0A0F9CPK4_9ZZZZ